MTDSIHDPIQTDDTTYCEVHPERETGLRCNKCRRLMCAQCAVQTPVGYRCRECVHQQDKKYFKGSSNDNGIAFGVSFILTAIAAGIFKALGAWLLLALIIGFPLGAAIGEAILRATSRRRTMNMNKVAAAEAVIGGLVGGIVQVYFYYWSILNQMFADVPVDVPADVASPPLNAVLMVVWNDVGFLLFVGIVAFAVYSRFRFRL